VALVGVVNFLVTDPVWPMGDYLRCRVLPDFDGRRVSSNAKVRLTHWRTSDRVAVHVPIMPFYKRGMSRKIAPLRLEAGAALESEAVINLFWTGIPLAFNRSQLFIPAS
jgi:hypothetical protein